jgi:ribosomal protein S6--L-glutamate ligase
MILSFHPCFVADCQVILGDRKLSADDRRLIRAADAIILPQTCSFLLYKICKNSEAHVFPDYDLRFRYPGKVGQSLLFEKLKIFHPATKRWPSVKKFRALLKQRGAPPHQMPFFLKADKSHEGEGVYVVDHQVGLDSALRSLENAGPEGFISQEAIPCKGNVLRAVVLHKKIMAYWKRPGRPNEVITTISQGSRVDKVWKPELQEKGRAQAQWIAEKTGINLAAFDFVFDLGNPDPQPLILEINYYFGRRGLGGSLKYYRLLLKAIREWLKENGSDAGLIKLV